MQAVNPLKAIYKRYSLRALGLLTLVAPFAITKMSTAGFSKRDIRTRLEIDGVNYGSFDKIDGLSEVGQKSSATNANGASFHKVSFQRDFVTDPSLYLWAKNVMHGRTELKDVHVVLANKDGEELSRYVLKLCKPLAWSVEAANPALGGFHETIDIAVQDIAIY